jgi:drug/metabolite transporter (DMT)-like permease
MSVNTTVSARFNWLLFLALSFMWGSSYLFIKIGVDAGLQPITLVMFRLLMSAAFLALVVVAARDSLPRSVRSWFHLTVIGFTGVVLPFVLITIAEQSVDSALAAILVAPVPLLVIPIAALVLPDEPVTATKVVGVLVGFVGVAILVGFDPAQLGTSDLAAELLLLGAAVSYAFNGVYARRWVKGSTPRATSFAQVFAALVMVSVLAFVFEQPFSSPVTFDAVLAVAWLGIIGSGAAFVVFFRLLGAWGAGRTSTVAYLMPVVGIVLGALVLSEPISTDRVVGTALVIGGIALVNMKREAIYGLVAKWRGERVNPDDDVAEAIAEQR